MIESYIIHYTTAYAVEDLVMIEYENNKQVGELVLTRDAATTLKEQITDALTK